MSAGEVVAAWGRTAACCGECATTFDGPACPNCGELPDASSVDALGFLFEGPDGARLSVATSDGSGWSRSVTDEQAGWLRRQGDVR